MDDGIGGISTKFEVLTLNLEWPNSFKVIPSLNGYPSIPKF